MEIESGPVNENEARRRPGVERVYENSEIAVLWEPKLCIHAGNCFRGLPGVFQPESRPWVNVDGATADQVALGLSDYKTEIIQFWNECENESSKTREDWQICGCDEERLLTAPYLTCAFSLFGRAKPHPPVAAVTKWFVLRVTAAA